MKKPGMDTYLEFEERFQEASHKAGKEQYLVPYFLSSHPGCEQSAAVDIAEFLQARRLRPQQVQDFIPTPGTPATCMWWTGLDPTRIEVFRRKQDAQQAQAARHASVVEAGECPSGQRTARDTGRTDLDRQS